LFQVGEENADESSSTLALRILWHCWEMVFKKYFLVKLARVGVALRDCLLQGRELLPLKAVNEVWSVGL
jgi:hypothetical protein